jgi:hypothetical protein
MVRALVIAVNRRVIVAGRCVAADAVRYIAMVQGSPGGDRAYAARTTVENGPSRTSRRKGWREL